MLVTVTVNSVSADQLTPLKLAAPRLIRLPSFKPVCAVGDSYGCVTTGDGESLLLRLPLLLLWCNVGKLATLQNVQVCVRT